MYGSIVLPPGLEGDFVWKGVVSPLKSGMNEFPDPALASVPRAATPLSYAGMQHDAFRVRNERVNEIVRTYVDDGNIFWCDFRSDLVNADGTPKSRFMREDRLHLVASGYDVWAEALKPILARIIGVRRGRTVMK